MNVLNDIVANKRRELEARRIAAPYKKSFSKTLMEDANGIIAEFKRCSPSKGAIKLKADPAVIVPSYEANGAACCSVLTDTRYFGGAVTDLMVARANADLPLLRKDFIVDECQIREASEIGANAVLLIASVLEAEQMQRFCDYAHTLSLEVLVEIHGEEEICKIPRGADMIGVNNRDLKTFTVSIENSIRLFPLLPEDALKISESGIRSIDDIRRLRKVGYRGFLIGESFMKTDDPGAELRKFLTE